MFSISILEKVLRYRYFFELDTSQMWSTGTRYLLLDFCGMQNSVRIVLLFWSFGLQWLLFFTLTGIYFTNFFLVTGSSNWLFVTRILK